MLPLPTQVAGIGLSDLDLALYQSQAPTEQRRPAAERPPQPESPPPAKAVPQIPAMGEVFTGKISQMDASAAVIDVPGFRAEQAIGLLSADVADLRRFKVGNAARVEVVEQKVQRSGRVLLIVRPAPPKPKDGQGSAPYSVSSGEPAKKPAMAARKGRPGETSSASGATPTEPPLRP